MRRFCSNNALTGSARVIFPLDACTALKLALASTVLVPPRASG